MKRMEGKPFVLLGVNSDHTRDGLQRVQEEQKLTWRSWWDGGSTRGPIASEWGVTSWPTMVLIDHRGIIRLRGNFTPAQLDKYIDQLVREAETEGKGSTS